MATAAAIGSLPTRPLWDAELVTTPSPAAASTLRRQIIDAAVPLIAERGFGATSVEEIAEAAGVAKGSVFYNFGSKAELFAAVLTDGLTRVAEALRSALARRPDEAPVDVLVEALLSQVHTNPAFAKVIAAEVFRTGRDWQDSIRMIHDEAIAVFAEALLAEHPHADPRDAEVTGAALFGATLVAGLEWLAFQPDRPLADVLPAVLRVVPRS